MARSGAKRGVGSRSSTGSEETRRALVRGAIEALRDEGFSGASAREIARRAGCNQGLVFYHFGSVTNLLLAALDEVERTAAHALPACRATRPTASATSSTRPSRCSRRTSTRDTCRCWPR